MKRAIVAVGFLALYFGTGQTVQAQERATIQALATVVSSLSIQGTNDLQFGTVSLGVNKSVGKTDIGFAGEWTVTGTPSAELSIQFTLPTALRTSDTLSTIPISFGPTDASYGSAAGDQSSPKGTMNPNGPVVGRIGASGQLLIWIGGTVAPAISQTGGTYSAQIMLSVAYTGN